MQQALEIVAAGHSILGAPRDLSQPWGLFVQKDGLQGWGSLSAGRRETLARAVAHGEHDVSVYLPSRVVTVDGWAIERSARKLQGQLDTVNGIGATGEREAFQVTQWGDLRRAYGRRILSEAESQGRWQGRFIHAPFQLQFVFPDPRKYGEKTMVPESGTATTIDVPSMGNFPAFPEIELVSPPGSYTITSPGGTFTVSGATPGAVHVVNLRNGRVYRAGVEMPGVGRGDLWSVPAGRRWRHTLSTPGRIRIADTFV